MAVPDPNRLVRSFKLRLYPNRAQEAALNELLAHLCELYNACLQQRIEAYRRQSKTLSFIDQSRELTTLRREMPTSWGVTAQRGAIKRLDLAFQAFFRRLKRGERLGFPRFKSVRRFDTIAHDDQDGWSVRSGKLNVKGVGDLKVEWHRSLPSAPRTCLITRRAGGWFVVFQCRVQPDSLPATGNAVGVDVGLITLVATNDGERIERPGWDKQAKAKTRRLARAVSRKQRGSWRRLKAVQRLRRHRERVANRRRDFAHKLTTNLVRKYDLIAVEKLNVAGMGRGRFSGHIQDVGWGMIFDMLVYKAEGAGRELVKVDPRNTSQACSGCGVIVLKALAERIHRCGDCGLVMDRDENAARNILAAGMAVRARSTAGGPRLAREVA